MEKYIAFLRGINISGKNKIAMKDLKEGFESLNFSNVQTYLNSGNVIFESEDNNARQKIEKMIKDKFSLEIPTYLISFKKLEDILAHAPKWWNDVSTYNNIIFILSNETPEKIKEVIGDISEEYEKIETYDNIIFWSYDKKYYQKCKWWKKTAQRGIGEKLTIRNANTIRKALS